MVTRRIVRYPNRLGSPSPVGRAIRMKMSWSDGRVTSK
jgi:hypothetical protein